MLRHCWFGDRPAISLTPAVPRRSLKDR